MKKKCVIIPAYNEEKNISKVINGIKNHCDTDIIVIDDGSTDMTSEIAVNSGACVIHHPFQLGYGVTLQTGYKFAVKNNYDLLLQMDGDGQHNPETVCDFFKIVESDQCDVLVGSRFLGKKKYKTGFLKFLGILIFRFIIRLISGEKITDPTSGYQCLNRKVFSIFTADSFPWDYPDANILIMLYRKGFVIKEFPVVMTNNIEGRSMHQGILTKLYYVFKMFFSIFIILIRGK